ncbi:hypothetical protein [Planktotalea sp.]|uniref:hypothetical protein n=1 Tax=Planktotalea sp. TaxID=2029877 RepID=UPI003D6ACB5E
MSTLFEPNYPLYTFLMIKTFFYIEVVGVLALIRVFVASGPSRIAALIATLVALVGVAARFAPSLAGVSGTEAGRLAASIVNQGVFTAGSGMALPIVVSLIFALSWRLRGHRWWALDAVHLLAAIGFFGLWIYTSL